MDFDFGEYGTPEYYIDRLNELRLQALVKKFDTGYEKAKNPPFDTGYERIPGQEVYVEEPNTPVNKSKTGYYNKTQAERLIINAIKNNINPFEVLTNAMAEGSWAKRAPGTNYAWADVNAGGWGLPFYKRDQAEFDYLPGVYNDYYSNVQRFSGDPLTEKTLERMGYNLNDLIESVRIPEEGIHKQYPRYTLSPEILALARFELAKNKRPYNLGSRLAYFQHHTPTQKEINTRLNIYNSISRNKAIKALVSQYQK